MLLRNLLVPALLIGGLALATADDANASPIGAVAKAAHGGGVYISGGVTVPVRTRAPRRVRARSVQYVGGYYKTVYETRIDRVWHARELVGYDTHGRAIYSPGHWDEVEVRVPVRVWVPRRRVAHRTVRRAVRPAGFISVGGTVRVR